MPAEGQYRADGLPNTAQTISKAGVNISTPAMLVTGGNGDVNVTDIIASKNSDGDITFYDGPTQLVTLYLKASDNGEGTASINLTSAIKCTSQSGLHVGCESTDTDYSVLVNYYVDNRR